MSGDVTNDELVLRVEISLFKDTRDVLPRTATPTYGELVDLVAPERPPIRADRMRAEARRLRLIDDAETTLLAGAEPSAWLGDHPTFRLIEKAAWTAGTDRETRARAIREAAAQVRDAARRRTKTRLPCWSPVRCFPAATRGISAVDVVTCLVLDYDDGTEMSAAVAPWLDWPLIAATTWSHHKDRPRFRVILVLAEPVPAVAWPGVWRWAAERSAGQVDPACKDPSRLYLLPAVRSARAPFQRLVHDPGGHLLCPDWEQQPEPVVVPPDARDFAHQRSSRPIDPARVRARSILKQDEAARGRAAKRLDAHITGRRAEHIPCPNCGRPSVWFWLTPGLLSTAQCNHKRSCGWWGHLDELLDAHGDHHVR